MKGNPGPLSSDARHLRSISDPEVSALLLNLHRAVDVEGLWEAGKTLLSATMPHYHFLVALPCVGVVPIFLKTTLPIRPIPNYWEKFIASEPPLVRIVRDCPGLEVAFLSDHFTEEETKRSACYREFMKPDGWFYGAGFLYWDQGQFVGQFSCIRTPEQGDYLPAEREILRQLYPHFAAAVQRVVVLDRERSARAAAEAGLEQMPDGRIILDWNLRPVYQNQAAIEACSNWLRGTLNQPIRAKELTSPFALPPELSAVAARLLEEYRDAVRKHSLNGGIEKKTLNHPSVPGLSARLQMLELEANQVSEPHILIELSRVISAAKGPVARPFYTLTSSQRRVAELAAAGQSNQEIAQDLGVSVHTIRAHLREVFSKLGVSRRSQLADLSPKPN
jgi:DNA-binding CsgD family transcriptional regulator